MYLKIFGIQFYVMQLVFYMVLSEFNKNLQVQYRRTISATDSTSTTLTAIGHHSFLLVDLLTFLKRLCFILFNFFILSLDSKLF